MVGGGDLLAGLAGVTVRVPGTWERQCPHQAGQDGSGGQRGSRPGGRLPVGWAVLTRPMVGTAYLLAYIYIGESLNDCLQEVSSFSLIQTDPEVI